MGTPPVASHCTDTNLLVHVGKRCDAEATTTSPTILDLLAEPQAIGR